jgi:hypothetical protein
LYIGAQLEIGMPSALGCRSAATGNNTPPALGCRSAVAQWVYHATAHMTAGQRVRVKHHALCTRVQVGRHRKQHAPSTRVQVSGCSVSVQRQRSQKIKSLCLEVALAAIRVRVVYVGGRSGMFTYRKRSFNTLWMALVEFRLWPEMLVSNFRVQVRIPGYRRDEGIPRIRDQHYFGTRAYRPPASCYYGGQNPESSRARLTVFDLPYGFASPVRLNV